jgi:hypothetical protein
MIKDVGFRLISVTDTSEGAAQLAGRWYAAREKYHDQLATAEGPTTFDGLQNFLHCVRTLLQEKRLLRLFYVARKGQ